MNLDEAKAAHEALQAEAKWMAMGEAADLRLAELELAEARVEERRAEAHVERMVERAPIGGIVVVEEARRGFEFGQIQAGDELRPGQPYVRIVDSGSMIVEAIANQVDADHLRLGAHATVRFDAFPDLELQAQIYSIGPIAGGRGWRTSYVARLPVYLRLDHVDPRVIPNLTVSADVVLSSARGQEIVPRESVFRDPEGRSYAYVQTPSGWEKRGIELGVSNNIEAAVRSGLREGDVVATITPAG